MSTGTGEATMPVPDPSNWSSAEITERSLLQSVVEVARIVFGAAAASVFLLDPDTGDLVFEAVAGEGEDHLVGTRFPSGTGLAGWVVMSGEAILVDDVSASPQFARDAAESTGYVPGSIMAAPLIRRGECIGVLEVLDRGTRPRGDLSDVDLIGMLATEVALGLELLIRLRQRAGLPVPRTGGETDLDVLRRVADRLPYAGEPVASTVSRLLVTADDLLAQESDSSGVSR
jgi:GAF domain-containing protein